jgi:hypothetical protein
MLVTGSRAFGSIDCTRNAQAQRGRLPTSGTRASEVGRRSHSTSRVAKWREDWSHPSEKDRCRRSRDLVNSEVCRVNAQTFGTPSREGARSEKRTVIGSGS